MSGAQATLRVLPFALLVDEAWRSTRRGFRAIWVPLAVALAPAALALQVVANVWNLQLLGVDESTDLGLMCGSVLLLLALALLAGLYFFFLYGTMMVAVLHTLDRGDPDLRGSLRTFLRPGIWGTHLMAWALTLLGYLACLLPGLLLMAAWGLRLPVMVEEGRLGFAALGRSWELLSHNPSGSLLRHPLLKMMLVFLLAIVLGYSVALAIQMPALAVTQWMMFREVAAGEAADPEAVVRATLWLTIPSGVLASLAQLAVQLYFDFLVAHFYFDQRRRREGQDLEAALAELAGGEVPP
ncbi:MAG TPA: hypothetical protein VMT16_10505 [Thermoanaerobaculia bacterium]|nr:hypothetical protein [Thermoanaerobaculia bacterium]